MILFRRPSDAAIADYVARQADQPLSYDFAGETRRQPRPRRGWNVDHERILLGQGEAVFRRAQAAIDAWQMFPPAITRINAGQRPVAGLNAAVLYRTAAPLGLWMLFPLRVEYVIDDVAISAGNDVHRYGIASGTLAGHAERGEERFLVEWDQADDRVWYDLLAISRPSSWLARLGYPYARYEQARFRRLSCGAMRQAIESARPSLVPHGG